MILRNGLYAILTLLITLLVFTYLITNRPDKYIDELLFLGLLCCLGLLYLVMYYMLLRPLGQLAGRVVKIANGDLSQKPDSKAIGEIGEIAQSIGLIINNINQATNFIKNIEVGKIDLASHVLKGDDQLSNALRSMSWQIQKIADEERQRNWATEGTAKFVSILRADNDDMHALCDNIISNLVKYLKAQQGGLFIINDTTLAIDQRFLELYACYAYEERKFMEKRIAIGEGLVGQTYLQGETLQLTEVPQDYSKIVSGLGDATPQNILIVPIKVNQQVFGIVELASFFKFEPYQMEFVEKLGENIAATIANVKSNEKTRQLLEDAQVFAEQLRAQEEEMRQNVEELQSTQEEMSRKQAELEAANKKMETNEAILTKALDRTKAKEKEMAKSEREMAEMLEVSKMREEEMHQTIQAMTDNEIGYRNKIEELEQKLEKIKLLHQHIN
jgi:GAF domain-containing protein/HAMP domain-containing protein